jgi:hypothetical protein
LDVIKVGIEGFCFTLFGEQSLTIMLDASQIFFLMARVCMVVKELGWCITLT